MKSIQLQLQRRDVPVRMMMQVSIPVDAGNRAAQAGTSGSTLPKILEAMKPEAAYFTATESGERGGFVVFDLKDTSEIQAICEPFFLAFNAKVKLTPVMNPQDLAKAAPGIASAVKQFGKAASASGD